jgi:hypothetical protein
MGEDGCQKMKTSRPVAVELTDKPTLVVWCQDETRTRPGHEQKHVK